MYIYTDGSLQRRGGKIFCGYGIYFGNNEYKSISKPFTYGNPTNNRAELYAIYKSLKICKNKLKDLKIVNIVSDSEYCVKIFNIWLDKWIQQKKDYMNKDIIDKIKKILDNINFKVNFIHINSHTGKKDIHSLNNDKADELAKLGSMKV
jgi:ribonuclease HI